MMYKSINEENNKLLLKEISSNLVLALEDLIILFNAKIAIKEVKNKVAEVKMCIDDFWLKLENNNHNLSEDMKNYMVSIEKYRGDYINEVMTSWMINEQIDTTEIIHEMCYKIRELIKKLDK